MGAGVIELENIGYRDSDGELPSDISLGLQPESFHFLTGPSGADKTTLFKFYYGALLPTSGRLSAFGEDIAQLDRDQMALLRRRIGVVHQECHFPEHMAVATNVAFSLMVSRSADTSEQDDLSDLLGRVGLGSRLQAHSHELSVGERQRAALARPVILLSDVVLADEPTGSADWEISQRLLIELNRMGKTVLIATHDLSLIRAEKNQVQARILPISQRRLQLHGGGSMSKCDLCNLLRRDTCADRMVPPTGFTTQLTLFVSGAMATLEVFALALSLDSGRRADRWASNLPGAATLRINAPVDQRATQTEAALTVLQQNPGVASTRAMTSEEQVELLSPWFGTNLPLDTLPVPHLIEIIKGESGLDAASLRLGAEVPGVMLVDHTRWREPLVDAAMFLRRSGWISILLIGGATAAMITLAVNGLLAANAKIIEVLHQIGARDRFISVSFVRRFTFRTHFRAATVSTLLGMSGVLLLPEASDTGGFLTGQGFHGIDRVLLALIAVLGAAVAFLATWSAAWYKLKESS